jgi:uncharacterized protein YebE (UPF0316 family)
MSEAMIAELLFIFALRIFNSAIGTFRLVIVARGERLLAVILAFIEALTFAYTLANVVTDLSNIPNLIAYCGGFAVGNYVGMAMEARLVKSYVTVNIIARDEGHALAALLRENGYGVTETSGEGRDGTVTMLRSVVGNRDVHHLLNLIHQLNEGAFVSVEPAITVQRGWLGSGRHHL